MKEKCVIIVSRDCSPGIQANAAAILAAALARRRPDLIGPDVCLAGGQLLAGILRLPLPILEADDALLEQLAPTTEYVFTATAQKSRTYEEYMTSQAGHPCCPLGVLLIGPEKEIRRKTGSLPLMGSREKRTGS